jgi:hypothetical protein
MKKEKTHLNETINNYNTKTIKKIERRRRRRRRGGWSHPMASKEVALEVGGNYFLWLPNFYIFYIFAFLG